MSAVQAGQWLVALLGALYFTLERHLTARLQKTLLVVLGMLGAAAYVGFGTFNGHGRSFHAWDTFHYYVGAKYHAELGYERLYLCASVADVEVGRRGAVARRSMRDLHTNDLVQSDLAITHPMRCKAHFTPERWAAFVADVQFFERQVAPTEWRRILQDHGYNASPLWTLTGRALASLGPANERLLTLLTALDPLLLLGALVFMGRAFGLRVAALALLLLGVSYPSNYDWTGGAFLRMDWLFFTIAAICLAKEGRLFLAGAAIAGASLLRLFPAAALLGPGVAWLVGLWREARPPRAWTRLLAGAAVGGLLCVGLSLGQPGGVDAWRGFVRNTAKHAVTPLTNHMGLPTLLAYQPSVTLERIRESSDADPFPAFKEARRARRQVTQPLLLALGLAFTVALGRAVGGRATAPWVALALGLTGAAIFLELTNYYYVFIVALAPLASVRSEVARLLTGTAAASQLVAAPVFGIDAGFADERYVMLSALYVVAMMLMLRRFVPMRSRADPSRLDTPAELTTTRAAGAS